MQPFPSFVSELRLSLCAVALGVMLCACVGEEQIKEQPKEQPTLAQRLDALAVCTPSDQATLPWQGPAFDPETGALLEPLPAGHVEAVVTGWRIYEPEAAALRTEHATHVAADVFTRDGLLGFEALESTQCDISMSHTLWRDEASLFAFVTATPHTTAMTSGSRMHHAFAGAHWTGEARATAPTWKEGIDRLVKEKRAELE